MPGLFQDPSAATTATRFARVALERGLEKPRGLTYTIPDHLADLAVGDRVTVPLGRGDRQVSGYVLDIADRTDLDPAKLKPITGRDGRTINLPDELVTLARWIARYYCCPLGMVFASILPAAVKHGTGSVRRAYVDLHQPIDAVALPELVREHKLRGKQAAVLAAAVELHGAGKLPIEPKELADAAAARTVSPVSQLIEKGLLRRSFKSEVRAAWAERAVEPNPNVTLNDAQRNACDGIAASLGAGFSVHLLHGVTGSGKTEVYIRAIERVLAAGRGAIVLVPEISLTPQTVGRFLGRFGDIVAVLHSGLTAAQRHEQWARVRSGGARLVVGARSAVFAPVRDLGLVIVDEEHDSSYKQDQAPRYHARDVAVKRAQNLRIPAILGSATPSLESYHNAAERGLYRMVSLPARVSAQAMPKVELVDMREERRRRYQMTGSAGVHLLGLRLEHALRGVLAEGGQAMLLLNRRGYASYVACPDHRCGWVSGCDHCDAHMVYHIGAKLPAGGLVRCHYCGFENLMPATCPVCGKRVTPFGLGTQRVEDEVARKFGDVRAIRMDGDSMRTGRDYEASLGAFRRGEAKLLLGTQMIAKGLDFANVRLVGVISADVALHLPDFRAGERAFQLVCQVAGRSGRSAAGGRVIVQTFTPEHPAIRRAAEHDYEGFAAAELAQRRRAGLPPITRMARIVTRDRDMDKADAEAARLADVLRQANERLGLGAKLIGPMPAPLARIGGYHRRQVELIAETAATVQRLITAARDAAPLRSDAHTAVDVDPVNLL